MTYNYGRSYEEEMNEYLILSSFFNPTYTEE